MATPEAELAHDSGEEFEAEVTPLQSMPDDLRAKGWKLSRVDGQNYRARNDRLGLSGNALATPEGAIAQARALDAGKKMVMTPAGTTFEDEIATLREQLKPEGERPKPRMISHTLFRLDGGTQPREELDKSVIAEYAEAKKRGDMFPPVDAFFDGTWMWMADGFHRYLSDQLLGLKETFTNVHYGTQRDAVLYSLRANAAHGLPRSNADKRRAVLTLLKDPEWSQWSDNVIAQKVAVSQPFVSSLRRELSQNVLSERPATWQETIAHQNETGHEDCEVVIVEDSQPAPQPTKRVGRDGIERETRQIGRRPSGKITGGQTDILPEPRKEEDLDLRPGATALGLWPEEAMRINILVRAGKSKSRGITVSGTVGDSSKPIFLSEYSVADLEPAGPALLALLAKLNKAATRKPATRASKPTTQARTAKPKTKARKK